MVSDPEFPLGLDNRFDGEGGEEAAHAEFEAISALMQRGYPLLRFPAALEDQFTLHMRRLAQRHIGFSAIAVGLFFILVGACSWLFLTGPAFRSWLEVYLIQGASLFFVLAMTLKRQFRRYHQFYTGLAAWLALVGMAMATALIAEPAIRQYANYSVLYLTVSIYGLALMPLRAALGCGLLAMLTVVKLLLWLELPVDWLQFSQYFFAANVMGVLLGYLLEHRERTLFLTGRLLELEKAELDHVTRRLGKQSQEDPMTQLANRRYFNEVYQQEWDRGRRSGQPLSLIFIDVDHFKKYNDHYGHLEGDTCLIAVAGVLAAQVRRAGDLAVRYGGEEFVILLPNTPLDGALRVANKVLSSVDALNMPHAASTTEPYVTVSVGVASTKPDAALRALDLLEAADNALYEAKEGGRHRVANKVLELPKIRLADVAS